LLWAIGFFLELKPNNCTYTILDQKISA
jgi:hypothetical protein